MTAMAARRWLVPEIVQTSAMDCGPAALKGLLEGFRIPVSYGRLREACQTSVDGTSIDALELVANQLGLDAVQSLVPAELAFADPSRALPAIAITSLSDGSTHFVVVWSRHGDWLQVMDPGTGRRWVRLAEFSRVLLRHEMSVAAVDWRDWANSEDFLVPLRRRLAATGVSATTGERLIGDAVADSGWFPLATLEATTRMLESLRRASATVGTPEMDRIAETLFRQTIGSPDDIYHLLPRELWSVAPDTDSVQLGERHVLLAGAVLLTAKGRQAPSSATDLTPELAAAAGEKPVHPLRELVGRLAQDGLLTPLALGGAIGIASLAMLAETALLRGMLEMAPMLAPGLQRGAAGVVLLILLLLAFAVRFGIASEALRQGRALELRLRMALLDKLPRLADRYFQSRPISDMADRGHSLHLLRAVPGLGIHFLQTAAELALMLSAVVLLDPVTGALALLIAVVQIGLASLAQPLIGEADLRVRTHAAALHGLFLDTLLGAVAIRVHRAQRAVRRRHESLLVDLVRAMRVQSGLGISLDLVQQVLAMGLLAAILALHFWRAGAVGPTDLLLVYWLLKLPVAGGTLAALAHQYPAMRNVLTRLLEPLGAPEAAVATTPIADVPLAAPVSISVAGGTVVAGGHTILSDIGLEITPGEHVAIVGPSGAGKSSLIGLLLGWNRLTAGTLAVDGLPLDTERLAQLRRATAWVDPAVQLWNSSLADNVGFATATTSAGEIGDAIDRAELADLVARLPDGLATLLGESGGQLSGGEGQRVRLARALAQRNVRLALLDEPFRGMDRAQRLRLLSATREHWAGTTLLCVTHDIAETALFDRVLVVEDGHIVEDGHPAQLEQRFSRYRSLRDADHAAQAARWGGPQWRRLRLGGEHG